MPENFSQLGKSTSAVDIMHQVSLEAKFCAAFFKQYELYLGVFVVLFATCHVISSQWMHRGGCNDDTAEEGLGVLCAQFTVRGGNQKQPHASL